MAGELTIVLDEKDLRKVEAILDGYSKVDQSSIIQGALKKGMEVIVAEGQANLAARNKKKTGNLARSFKMTANRRKSYSLGGFKKTKMVDGKKVSGGNHAYLVDRGTAERWTRKGAYRGSVSKGNPNHGSMFWTNAVETKGQEGLQTLMKAIYDTINEINQRNSN